MKNIYIYKDILCEALPYQVGKGVNLVFFLFSVERGVLSLSSSTMSLNKTSSLTHGEVPPGCPPNPPVSLPDFPVIKASLSFSSLQTDLSRQDFHLPHSVPADRLNTFLTR